MIAQTILLVVAYNGYQPTEYGVTRDVLEQAGFKVVVASNKLGTAHAMPTGTASPYDTVAVDIHIENVTSAQYDGIFFIGGSGVLEVLNTPFVHALLQNAYKQNKVIGGICIAPRILAHAGILTNKAATGWNGDRKLDSVFKEYNVNYIQEAVVIDKNIITADGPMAAEEFGKTIAKTIKKK